MPDIYTADQRSVLMGRVRSRDTQPELLVRRALHRVGLRFRLYPRNLPGRPDIVLPRHRVAVFVHGCFWHQHDCRKGTVPRNNHEFWEAKLRRNVERDREKREALEALGWRVLTVWQCESKRENLGEWLRDLITADVHATPA